MRSNFLPTLLHFYLLEFSDGTGEVLIVLNTEYSNQPAPNKAEKNQNIPKIMDAKNEYQVLAQRHQGKSDLRALRFFFSG